MAKITVKTTVKDMGFDRIKRQMAEIERRRPLVVSGVISGESKAENNRSGGNESDKIRNIDIAVFQEFGTETIPERSHFRAGFDENINKLQRAASNLFGKILDGTETIDGALNKLGLRLQTTTKKKIQEGLSPGLKSREGTPLFDTGQYINSITFEKRR